MTMVFRDKTLTTLWMTGGAALALAVALPGAHAGAQQQKKGGKPAAASTGGGKTGKTGEQVWREQCAPCHGAKGEGTGAYSRPLTGDLSVGQLAKYIAKSMPPGPKKCSVPDSQKVAAYIHDAFYSPVAQERNRPARIVLSRLSVGQMRNAVADLVGGFRPNGAWAKEERGLKAEYFKARHFQEKERVMQRVDPEVRFDFGTAGPTGGEFDPHQFSIRWNGSLVAPQTGRYEFVVRTEHAMRLWVNDPKKPLLDAWVKSGNDTEYRASMFLVGGRSYPLRLEFSKSTLGVDDTEKKKGVPPVKASVVLAWKAPGMEEEPIPSRCLVPEWSPERFVLEAPFPPDDRSMGYERGDSVSKAWDDATTEAALETADYVVEHLKELAGSPDDPEKLKDFCRRFVTRALRRPLDPETEKRYITNQFAATSDLQTAVKRVILLTLKSPRFLYREIGTGKSADPYDVASRLSFTLWDSIPDDALLQAAASGKLSTRAEVAAQAERMAADPRAWNKQREFFLQWLKIDPAPDLAKDKKRFAAFTPAVASDLRTSFELTLESIMKSERADFRELMLTDKFYLNGRLAKIYGAPLAPDAPFQPVTLDPKVRAGLLTHPYLLASLAYVGESSPIHRGVLLARSVMGRTLRPPQEAFVPLSASLHPKLTTRERVALQTKPEACMSCHSLINPLGFTLERFDAIGKLRDTENGKPIDATGKYIPASGDKPVTFNGAQDLARFVADSDEVHAAFVEKLFQFSVKQPIRAYGPQALPRLKQNFKAGGYNVRKLLVDIATESALPSAK
jgi:Cytochrome c